MAPKKKTPAKRNYTKNAKGLKASEAAFKQALDEFKSLPKDKLDELEFLWQVILGLNQMTNDQKSRFMNYLYSRYWMYITLSKLTQ